MNALSIKQAVTRLTALIVLLEFANLIIFSNTPNDIKLNTIPYLHVTTLALIAIALIYLLIIRPYVVTHEHSLDQIKHNAFYDPLTDIPNRRMLTEYTERLLSSFQRHKYYGALLYIDLDSFNIINDHHGYDIGDAILIETASRLTSQVRGEDIVGRVSGNAFVIVLDQLSIIEEKAISSASKVSKRVQNAMNEKFNIKGKVLFVEASIGQHILTPEPTSVETAIKNADTDMRHVRRTRKTN